MYRQTWLSPDDEVTLRDILRLVVLVSRNEPFVGIPSGSSDAATTLADRLTAGLRSGTTHVLAVRDSADDVVACVAMTRPPTGNQHHIAELTTGAVHPAHRGRGLVTTTFRHVVARCEQLGIDLLRLDVREGIRAEKLWRAYGFEVYGRLADYGRIDGDSYAGLYMAQPVAELRTRIGDKDDADAEQG